MPDALSIVSLIGLFSTCLDGYKICLAASTAIEDANILRNRMFLEKERFLNVGRTCGLLPHHGRSQRAEPLRQFLEGDSFRRKCIGDILESIASLLSTAEKLDRKYEPQEGLPDSLKEKQNVIQDTVNGGIHQFRTSLRKITWSIRDKTAYEGLLNHLVGFNSSLERVFPEHTQQFLCTVLPATVCAASDENELSALERASTQHAFLQSQLRWARSVHELTGGIKLKAEAITKLGGDNGRDRYLAAKEINPSLQHLVLVDWHPWVKATTEISDRIHKASGLLGGDKCEELRLFTCVGYLEDRDNKNEKVRYALVYRLPCQQNHEFGARGNPPKIRSLFQLLQTHREKLPPPLEVRLHLARTLCRALLLYHGSGWIHHDFRSHNILLLRDPPITSEMRMPEDDMEYQGLRIDHPYLVGFGFARDEADVSYTFDDKKIISQPLKELRRYWSPSYLASSGEKREGRSFERFHDLYSLGCVLLEIGVWKPLESYSWESQYNTDHNKWHKRLLKEEGKLRAMCGSRFAEAVMSCLTWGTSDIQTDVQMLAFDILLKLEEIVV